MFCIALMLIDDLYKCSFYDFKVFPESEPPAFCWKTWTLLTSRWNVLLWGLMLLMNMSLNQPSLFPLCPSSPSVVLQLWKMPGECISWPKECFICSSYRFSLNDGHYGLRAAEQAASNCIRSLKFFSPLPFSLQGVMQSNLGKRPGVAGAVMCKRLLC